MALPRKQCRCGATFVQVPTNGGSRMPIDTVACDDGNVTFVPIGDMQIAVTLGGDVLNAARANDGVLLFKTHFATCPLADEFRAGKDPTRQED